MIRLAVVEDDAAHAAAMVKLIRQYEQESSEIVRLSCFTDGVEIAEKYSAEYDAVFLDIEMGLMDGIETAEKIRAADEQVILVFTTSNPQYAIRGYSVHALDYLLKPITYESFLFVMRKVQKEMRRIGNDSWLTVSTRTGIEKIRISDLLWVESSGHRITFHTTIGDRETTVYSLSEIEDQLTPYGFFRTNSWRLIHLDKVQSYKNGIVTIGGESFPVSRAKKANLMNMLADNIS